MTGSNATPAPRARRRWPLRLALSLVVAIAALELILGALETEGGRLQRPGGDVGGEHGIYQPHPYMGYSLRPLTGTQGTNLLGLRGSRVTSVKAPGTYRILCLGGSTTFGSGLTPDESYPAQLAALLAGRDDRTFEVVNCGVPGYTTAESLINLALRLVDLKPDAIVVYHGVNDARLIQARGFLSDYSHMRRSWTGRSFGAFERWLLDHSASWRRVAGAVDRLPASRLEHVVFVEDYRERFLSPREHEVNRAGVAAFGRNVAHIVAIARAHGIEVALVTFAFCPAKVVSGKQQELGPTVTALNLELRRLGAREGVPVVMLEPLSRRPELFHDYVHLTAEGARAQARLVASQARDLGLWGL